MQKDLDNCYKYCIPIYLNQPIVFDLLAMLENGFTNLSKIKVSSKETETSNSNLESSFGISNVFALLDVKFGGAKSKGLECEDQKEVSEDRIHTPSSLFAKLRLLLYEQELIHNINSVDDIDDLESGEFVEFRAVLRKNPIVELFDTINRVADLVSLFASINQQTATVTPNENATDVAIKNNSSRHKRIEPRKDNKETDRSIDPNIDSLRKLFGDILNDLTKDNSVEIIGDVLGAPGLHALLSSKIEYFIDKNAAEIIDGEFKVLGKVVRVLGPGSEDRINLLRKTSFRALDNKMMEEFASLFNNDKTPGLRLPDVISEVKGPAIQVIPISIFT